MTGLEAASWVLTVCTTPRLSQTRTLADLVAAALVVGRVSLAELGRKLVGGHVAKHQIKRAWRFCANRRVAVSDAMQGPIARLCGRRKRPPGVEDATRGVKQHFHLESFLVRSWRSIRRLLWLVAWAFFWLNLWGEERFGRLREALLHHPWRLSKEVTYLFDWIAQMIHQLLHPRPKIQLSTG